MTSGTHGSRVGADFLQRVTQIYNYSRACKGRMSGKTGEGGNISIVTLKAEWAKHWEGKFGRGGERAPDALQGLGSSDHSPGPQFPC